jgi:archaellum component FlaG (FlaF/FlaG flagellin family)
LKIKFWAVSSSLAFLATMLATGCAPASNNTGSNSGVSITYSGTFSGQAASGYLNLMVDVTIENNGQSLFNTSPDNFSMLVDGYAYPVFDNEIQTIDLSNGDKISGKLQFQVPPEAATSTVGYKLDYSGQTVSNIQWIKQDNTRVSSTDTNVVVSITYTGSYMWVKETKSLYLLVDMTIENKGYESFNTSPEYFSLVIGNILDRNAPVPPIPFDGLLSSERDGSYSDLRSYDLQDGGKLTGRLAFQVPTDILASTESYRIEYNGVRVYNIQWYMVPATPE